jgi:molybdate/tungstate transport system substrate-binding protein
MFPCDVFISADYRVIDNFLIPGHASWNIPFAGNEMAIVYNPRSRYAEEIDSVNWYEILLRNDVIYGRSDPDSDPCGARTVIMCKLAGIYYEKPGLADMILSRHHNMIRPRETDLLALLETGTLDYIFLYRSVAEQHGLKYTLLPGRINLSDPGLDNWYSRVNITSRGSKPHETFTEKGEAIVYGITIPHKTLKKDMAVDFLGFFLSEAGRDIMERNGQRSLVPSVTASFDMIPAGLKVFALPPGKENKQ